jgi:hypothetical protein
LEDFRAKIAFGLSFDVEGALANSSGFKAAEFDYSSRKALFGDLRLYGFAAALNTGFVEKLVIVGGTEARYDGHINRAVKIRDMLVKDLGMSPGRIEALPSGASTAENIAAIGSLMDKLELAPSACEVISNHYHLPRIHFDLVQKGLPLRLVPAEAFWLFESRTDSVWVERTNYLISRFGTGQIAERLVGEIIGIADKMKGTYTTRSEHSVTEPK